MPQQSGCRDILPLATSPPFSAFRASEDGDRFRVLFYRLLVLSLPVQIIPFPRELVHAIAAVRLTSCRSPISRGGAVDAPLQAPAVDSPGGDILCMSSSQTLAQNPKRRWCTVIWREQGAPTPCMGGRTCIGPCRRSGGWPAKVMDDEEDRKINPVCLHLIGVPRIFNAMAQNACSLAR